MSQIIKLRRSAIQGKLPTTSSLDLGEIAINTYDGKVYLKRDDGTESIQTILVTNSQTTGSIDLVGSLTASFFSGDGTNIINVQTSSFALTASYVDFTDIDNKPTLLSGSSQIASEISGAFTDVSTSLSTRVTDLETFSSSIDNTEYIYSGSFSGSFVGDGSQLSGVTSYTDADTLSYINSIGVLSGSEQIASEISGAFTSVSSSFASGRLKNTTDTLTGDLTVTGKITAQEFHTEFVSSSIIYQSGSTKFGDTLDDIHSFTGSVEVSGSVSVDGDTVFNEIDKLILTGSMEITGSLFVSETITGSLFGTASFSDTSTTSSFSFTTLTASFIDGGLY